MMNVMKRAWEIYRTLTGEHLAKLSAALRQAWAEIKNTAKVKFEGFAKIAKRDDNLDDDCAYLTFKAWEKHGKKRIYINDYKRRTLGYIENGVATINDNCGNYQHEIDRALNTFFTTYDIA